VRVLEVQTGGKNVAYKKCTTTAEKLQSNQTKNNTAKTQKQHKYLPTMAPVESSSEEEPPKFTSP